MSPAVVAALVSACVVGAVALVNTLVGLSGGGRNAARQAHRELLGPYLGDLGRDLPGVVATSKTYAARVRKGENVASWRTKALNHADGLKTLRTNLRFLLYGADEGFRVLIRVGSWIQHFNAHPAEADQLLAAADELREILDKVVAKSYRRGEPPTRFDKRKIETASNRVIGIWAARMGRPRSELEDD